CLYFPFLTYLFFNPKTRRRRTIAYLIGYFPVLLFASLRADVVGTDTQNYKDYFEFVDSDFVKSKISIDFLFTYFVYFVKSFGFGFDFFKFLQASLSVIFYSIGAGRIDKQLPVLGLGIFPVLL